jgi:hypothetical protein
MKKALIVLSVIVVLSGSLIATAKPGGGKPPEEEYEYTVVFSDDISSTSMTFSDGVTGSWDGKEWSAWSDHAFGDFQFPDQAVEDCQLYQLDRDLFKRGKVDNGIRWRVDILAGGDRFTCIQYESIGLVTRMLDADTWVAEFHNAELVRRFSDGTYEIISVDFQFTLTRTLK